jgi:hypothetical protein
MSCNNKISDRCVKKTSAICVNYEGYLSDDSALTASACLNVEDVIEDISNQLNLIQEKINVESLSADTCIDYPTDGINFAPPIVTTKTAILELNTRIKDLMEFVGMTCDGSLAQDCPKVFTDNIDCLGLDYGVLVDACGDQPTNLKEVIQILLDALQN